MAVMFQKSEGFAENVLRKLNSMRSEGSLCDVAIECGDGQEILCHSFVLITQCSGVEEKMKTTIGREFVSALVDFCYSGVLRVTIENVVYLLKAATFLSLEEEARKFLEVFVVDHISILAKKDDIIPQLEVDTLSNIVSSKLVRQGDMVTWYQTVFTWWMANSQERNEEFKKLMMKMTEVVASISEEPPPPAEPLACPLTIRALESNKSVFSFGAGVGTSKAFRFGESNASSIFGAASIAEEPAPPAEPLACPFTLTAPEPLQSGFLFAAGVGSSSAFNFRQNNSSSSPFEQSLRANLASPKPSKRVERRNAPTTPDLFGKSRGPGSHR